jgi:hypothetical protein
VPPPLRAEPLRWSRSRTTRPNMSCARWSSLCHRPRSGLRDGWRGAGACIGRTCSCWRSPTRSPGWGSPSASTGCSRTAASRPRAPCGPCWPCWARWRSRARLTSGSPPTASTTASQTTPATRTARTSTTRRDGVASCADSAMRMSAGCSAARTWPTPPAMQRTYSPTATCASSAVPSRSGWRPGWPSRSASASPSLARSPEGSRDSCGAERCASSCCIT